MFGDGGEQGRWVYGKYYRFVVSFILFSMWNDILSNINVDSGITIWVQYFEIQ